MSSLRAEAILLRAVDYGESDRIVHLLTAEGGRLTAIAKAARRSQRRFPGTLDVFNRLEIEGRLRPRSSMAFLERAKLVDPYLGLRQDAARYALASFVMEMLDRLSPEGIRGPEAERLFGFAVESLSLLESVRPDAALRVFLELRALDALGLRPELGRCVRCARMPPPETPASHRVSFHVADGGIVCSACGLRLDGLIPVEIGTLRRLEEGLGTTPDALPALELDERARAQAERLVFRFQRFHVGVELRSERFLNDVLPAVGTSGP
jgi:DNA repair protein RecO (recombination protein O)